MNTDWRNFIKCPSEGEWSRQGEQQGKALSKLETQQAPVWSCVQVTRETGKSEKRGHRSQARELDLTKFHSSGGGQSFDHPLRLLDEEEPKQSAWQLTCE